MKLNMVLTCSGLLLLMACGSDDGTQSQSSTTPTTDTQAPLVGSLAFSNVDYTQITLSWTAATDEVTASPELKYKLVTSTDTALIDTIDEVEAISGASLLIDWQKNKLSHSMTGLSQTTKYAFAVLVKDAAGNKALYTPGEQITPTEPSATNLISHWKFDSTYNDETGLTHFTPVNNPQFSTSKVKFGTHSIQFNGIDQYLTTNYDFSGVADFTMAGWVYVESVPSLTLNHRVGFWGQNDLIEMGLMFNAGFDGFRLCLWVSGSTDACDTSNFPIGEWVHVAIIGSTTQGTAVYKNGALVASSVNTNAGASTDKLNVANAIWNSISAPGSEFYFHGFIDELAMWNRVLSSAEIQDLANL